MEMLLKIQGFSGKEEGLGDVEHQLPCKVQTQRISGTACCTQDCPNNGYDKFMQKNNFAFAEMLISSENNVCLGLVDSSRSELMPEADARLAWTNLVQKFAPTTNSNLIKT
jgi:hypothetical protein